MDKNKKVKELEEMQNLIREIRTMVKEIRDVDELRSLVEGIRDILLAKRKRRHLI